MEKELMVNDKKYRMLCLLGKENDAFYPFINKIEAVENDYERLKSIGIRLPEMLDSDINLEPILKEYFEGDTIFNLVLEDGMLPENMSLRFALSDQVVFKDFNYLLNNCGIEACFLLTRLFNTNKGVLKHSVRVGQLMKHLIKEFDELSEHVNDLILASILHDIGKIKIPDSILSKPSALSSDEWKIMKEHSNTGGRMVERMLDNIIISESVKYHHEKWDGTGYPFELTGNEIPLHVRLLSICDSIDAMLTDRPYKKKMSYQNCFHELKRNAGTQFDPILIDIVIPKLSEYFASITMKEYDFNLD